MPGSQFKSIFEFYNLATNNKGKIKMKKKMSVKKAEKRELLSKRQYSKKYQISLPALRWAREKGDVSCELIDGEFFYKDTPPGCSRPAAAHTGTWRDCIEVDRVNHKITIYLGDMATFGITRETRMNVFEIEGIDYIAFLIKGKWDIEEL